MLRVPNQKIRPDYSGLRSKFETKRVFGSSPTLYHSPKLTQQPKLPRGAPIPSKDQPKFVKVLAKAKTVLKPANEGSGKSLKVEKHLVVKSQGIGKFQSAHASSADTLDFPKGYKPRRNVTSDGSSLSHGWNIKGESTWAGHSRFHSDSQQTALYEESLNREGNHSGRSHSNGSSKSKYHPHDPRSKLEAYLSKPNKRNLLRGGKYPSTTNVEPIKQQSTLTLSALEEASGIATPSPALQSLLLHFRDGQTLSGWKGADEATLTASLLTNEAKQHTHRGVDRWVQRNLDFIPE